jgi:hypothetical protein
MEERNEWKRQLDLNDIQTALGTKHRRTLREKIKTAKGPLVDFLDDSNPELERLTAVLDDWFALPAKPKGPLMIPDGDKTPCYGDHFAVMEELIARLADDEYSLDLQLETEPPTTQEQYALQQNDPGRIFLKKLASAGGGHPLHSRLFPKQAGESRYAYVETEPEIPEDFDTGKLQAALKTSRRGFKFLREFVNHFSSLAEKGAQTIDGAGRLIAAGLTQVPMDELLISLEELISGDLKKAGYALVGKIVADLPEPIGYEIAQRYAEYARKHGGGNRNPITIYGLDGATHVGQASLGDFRNGSAFSSNHVIREVNAAADLSNIFFKVPAVKLSLVQKVKNSLAYNSSVLGGIALLEMWNVAAAINAVSKKHGKSGEGLAWAQLGEASAGAFSTAAMLRDEYIKRVAPAQVMAMGLPAKKSDDILKKILTGSLRWAQGLGAVANVYSTFMSGYQCYINAAEGDDAAISYAVMGAGFGVGTLVAGAKFALTFEVLSEIGWIGWLAGSPLGWIGLLLVLAGTALLVWVYKENTSLDWWLKHGPFSRPENPRQQSITREDGSRWLVGPKQNALKLDAFGRILEVIDDNPYGLFHTTPEGAVVARQGDDYRIIGFPGERIDKGFLAEFDAPRTAQRFKGHTPGTDPKDQYGWWYEHPRSAAKALADAVFAPKVTLNHRRAARINEIDVLEIRIDLGAFLDGKSKLFVELWRTERDGTLKDKPGEDKVRICTGEGSGPKTIRVEWPVVWSNPVEGIEHICARVRLDLNGDGTMWLPMPLDETGATLNEDAPLEENLECEVWRWEEVRTVLHMHRGKWEMMETQRRKAARQAQLDRVETRLKQHRGEGHD